MSKIFTLGDFKPETSLEAICKKYVDKPNTDFTIKALKSELSTYAMSMLRDTPRADIVECDATETYKSLRFFCNQETKEIRVLNDKFEIEELRKHPEIWEEASNEENRTDSTGDYEIKPATDWTS